jgi:hypothetical protein
VESEFVFLGIRNNKKNCDNLNLLLLTGVPTNVNPALIILSRGSWTCLDDRPFTQPAFSLVDHLNMK